MSKHSCVEVEAAGVLADLPNSPARPTPGSARRADAQRLQTPRTRRAKRSAKQSPSFAAFAGGLSPLVHVSAVEASPAAPRAVLRRPAGRPHTARRIVDSDNLPERAEAAGWEGGDEGFAPGHNHAQPDAAFPLGSPPASRGPARSVEARASRAARTTVRERAVSKRPKSLTSPDRTPTAAARTPNAATRGAAEVESVAVDPGTPAAIPDFGRGFAYSASHDGDGDRADDAFIASGPTDGLLSVLRSPPPASTARAHGGRLHSTHDARGEDDDEGGHHPHSRRPFETDTDGFAVPRRGAAAERATRAHRRTRSTRARGGAAAHADSPARAAAERTPGNGNGSTRRGNGQGGRGRGRGSEDGNDNGNNDDDDLPCVTKAMLSAIGKRLESPRAATPAGSLQETPFRVAIRSASVYRGPWTSSTTTAMLTSAAAGAMGPIQSPLRSGLHAAGRAHSSPRGSSNSGRKLYAELEAAKEPGAEGSAAANNGSATREQLSAADARAAAAAALESGLAEGEEGTGEEEEEEEEGGGDGAGRRMRTRGASRRRRSAAAAAAVAAAVARGEEPPSAGSDTEQGVSYSAGESEELDAVRSRLERGFGREGAAVILDLISASAGAKTREGDAATPDASSAGRRRRRNGGGGDVVSPDSGACQDSEAAGAAARAATALASRASGRRYSVRAIAAAAAAAAAGLSPSRVTGRGIAGAASQAAECGASGSNAADAAASATAAVTSRRANHPQWRVPGPGDARKGCNCRKSRCLKLYCECFAAGFYCLDCNCTMCLNREDEEPARREAVESILERNPGAFKPKIEADSSVGVRHCKGCNCRKSGCLKKYCECFQANIRCGPNCKCQSCKNVDGNADLALALRKRAASEKAAARASQRKRGRTPTDDMFAHAIQSPRVRARTAAAAAAAAAGHDDAELDLYDSGAGAATRSGSRSGMRRPVASVGSASATLSAAGAAATAPPTAVGRMPAQAVSAVKRAMAQGDASTPDALFTALTAAGLSAHDARTVLSDAMGQSPSASAAAVDPHPLSAVAAHRRAAASARAQAGGSEKVDARRAEEAIAATAAAVAAATSASLTPSRPPRYGQGVHASTATSAAHSAPVTAHSGADACAAPVPCGPSSHGHDGAVVKSEDASFSAPHSSSHSSGLMRQASISPMRLVSNEELHSGADGEAGAGAGDRSLPDMTHPLAPGAGALGALASGGGGQTSARRVPRRRGGSHNEHHGHADVESAEGYRGRGVEEEDSAYTPVPPLLTTPSRPSPGCRFVPDSPALSSPPRTRLSPSKALRTTLARGDGALASAPSDELPLWGRRDGGYACPKAAALCIAGFLTPQDAANTALASRAWLAAAMHPASWLDRLPAVRNAALRKAISRQCGPYAADTTRVKTEQGAASRKRERARAAPTTRKAARTKRATRRRSAQAAQ